jgi:superfamily II DNA/RNA helicase/cold shock CspA family protein
VPSFLDLGVDASIARRLAALGISEPRPVQAATLPEALSGRDVRAQAPTGSGKTLAFGIPLAGTPPAGTRQAPGRASTGGASPGRPRSLVLVPTRELADQVRAVLSSLVAPAAHRVVALYGGMAYGPQCRELRRGPDMVVACPGRLEDLVARRDVRLDGVQTVVLDEADRMVDMGFLRPVCRILDQTVSRRQLLLFSATMGAEVGRISARYQHRPHSVEIAPEPSEAGDVAHLFWQTPRLDRVAVTAQLIDRHGQAFVFCRTKRSADRVARQLQAAGVESAPIHGDRTQAQRAKALEAFARKRARALVATDVVARGIHVDDVPCVVHFDPPADADAYVHRSGRTGRDGNGGTVVSLVPDEVHGDVRALQRALGLPAELTLPFHEPPSAAGSAGAAGAAGHPRTAEGRGRQDARGRLQATVAFFDGRRGFGFLSRPDGADVFVHHSQLRAAGTGRPALRAGDPVSFELGTGRRGDEARDVALVGA